MFHQHLHMQNKTKNKKKWPCSITPLFFQTNIYRRHIYRRQYPPRSFPTFSRVALDRAGGSLPSLKAAMYSRYRPRHGCPYLSSMLDHGYRPACRTNSASRWLPPTSMRRRRPSDLAREKKNAPVYIMMLRSEQNKSRHTYTRTTLNAKSVKKYIKKAEKGRKQRPQANKRRLKPQVYKKKSHTVVSYLGVQLIILKAVQHVEARCSRNQRGTKNRNEKT